MPPVTIDAWLVISDSGGPWASPSSATLKISRDLNALNLGVDGRGTRLASSSPDDNGYTTDSRCTLAAHKMDSTQSVLSF